MVTPIRAQRTSRIDWISMALFISLVIIGWLMIYAASNNAQSDTFMPEWSSPAGKQLIFIGVSIGLFVITSLIDWKIWSTFAYPIYFISILLLVLVLLVGITVKGSTSWFSIGTFSLQPAEFAKFGTCVALASYLSYYRTDLQRLKYQLGAFGLMLLPAGLILMQPDAGSAMVFGAFLVLLYRSGMPVVFYWVGAVLIMLFIAAFLFTPLQVLCALLLVTAIGLSATLKHQGWWLAGLIILVILELIFYRPEISLIILGVNIIVVAIGVMRRMRERHIRQMVIVVPALVLSAAFVFMSNYAFEEVLEPHQQDRLNVWLRPDQCDPRGSLYNVLQSKIAIGSGGFIGKGYLQGTMTNLNYVPEQTTDFIFSTIGEEQGFLGSLGVIALYTLLLLRIVKMAERMRNGFSRNYAYGVAGILFVHFFINIGMTMGLMPIIGIPLPFLSYGGSSLLAFTIMMAVLFKMDRSRHV